MKKITVLFSLLTIGFILSSCRLFKIDDSAVSEAVSSQNQVTDSSKESLKSSETDDSSITESSINSDESKEIVTENQLADYFPETANKEYVYIGEGNEYASYDVFTDYEANNSKQTRTNNGGTEVVKVLDLEENQVVVRIDREETYTRENWLKTKISNKNEEMEILIKSPIKVGTSWEVVGERTRSITAINVSMTTPIGTFNTIEVTTGGTGDKEITYYAPNIGLVKSVFSLNGYNVTSTLSEINETPLMQTIRFYYPESDGKTMSFVDKEVAFKTNNVTRKRIEAAYKEVPNNQVGNVLSKNTKILSLYLNKDGHVYIDFSKELTSEMNAGTAFETLIMQSLVNTIGGYYHTNDVYLTVEGKPYSTGHIQMEKGEPFMVTNKNSHELGK
ncbi:Sporulation and spore germination [Carnobacterium iners]|uniref:Sporulation and spore germination n=1 Tax=Carnobacterium iners TaxID=1073423 RepID=A0A1X7N6G1_9LACT|nr:GerMN domain-containing protein [Carnobacterium iners]SEK46190.1 Sporulation and spore germination [Carnobacterium iners]SMH33057.1 Sporulation and spore germination [Carnobacterium iners]